MKSLKDIIKFMGMEEGSLYTLRNTTYKLVKKDNSYILWSEEEDIDFEDLCVSDLTEIKGNISDDNFTIFKEYGNIRLCSTIVLSSLNKYSLSNGLAIEKKVSDCNGYIVIGNIRYNKKSEDSYYDSIDTRITLVDKDEFDDFKKLIDEGCNILNDYYRTKHDD